MSVQAKRAQRCEEVVRTRPMRRRPRRRAVAGVLRWVMERLRRAGRRLVPELLDEAIDAAVDAAIPAIELGDSPFADDAEDVIRAAVDREGREWLRGVARDVWDDLDGEITRVSDGVPSGGT